MTTKTDTRPCIWTFDPDGYCWDTDCKQTFIIEDGTPEENRMRFCCFCGGELKQEVLTDDGQN